MFDAKDFYFDAAVLEAEDRQAETERRKRPTAPPQQKQDLR